jgi:hypothetical protein
MTIDIRQLAMRSVILAATALAACDYPRLANLASDAATGSDSDARPAPTSVLAAIDPPIANTGATITLEGVFASPITVTFPGGAQASATLLGPNRATVVVPTTATTGMLTVTSGGTALPPLPFHTASFTLGLESFAATYQQASGTAMQAPALATAGDGSTVAVAGTALYVIGGLSASGTLDTVEQATVNADGTLGAFANLGVTLATPRAFHSSVVIGSFLYVIGGASTSGVLSSIERATINADGTLGAFATVPGAALVTARENHTNVVIGDYLYVIGGQLDATSATTSIERATINADGTLGPFATVAGNALVTARFGHTSEVIGTSLYVIGGATAGASGVPQNTIEQATIHSDGTLGAFSIIADTLITARVAPTTAVLGSSLYVIGGQSSSGSLGSVEVATINADDTLGAFTMVAVGNSLVTARQNHTSAVVGNFLYVIGGISNATYLGGIEQASIDADGTLGTFATASSTLVTARYGACSVVIGDYDYVVGGISALGGYVGSVEQATVNPDGTLGAFATVTGVTLMTPRAYHTCAVIGNSLYAIGGDNSTAILNSVEQATINPDGTLGQFATISATLVTARGEHSSVVIGNSLFVIGGFTNVALNTVESAPIVNGVLGSFSTVSGVTLVVGRGGQTTAVISNSLYEIGGSNGGFLRGVEIAPISLDALGNVTLGTFAAAPSIVALVTARWDHVSAVIGNFLYVAGGQNGGPPGGVLTSVERASITNGAVGAFSTVLGVTLQAARTSSTSVAIGNFLYAAGGWNYSTTSINGVLDSADQAVLQ